MQQARLIKQRNVYISRIKPFMKKSLVKVMVGHRRVGKSYILYQLMELIQQEEPNANIIYINKEDIDFVDIKTYRELNEYIVSKSLPERINYIFIDEIQEIQDFRIAIRSLALNDNNDLYITGSNSEIFSSDLANELGGRYIEFVIHSLSYQEFLEFHGMENNDTTLERYIHYGGLPYLIHLPMEETVVMEYIKSVYATIVLKDVMQRKNLRNTVLLEQLVLFLAGNVGNLFSSKSISDFLKGQKTAISQYVVDEYATALVDACLISKVKRYDIAGKKLFERGEKYYFENLGIRNAITGYKHHDRARRLENLVYNHLVYCGYDVKVGTLGTKEIDFVCRRNGETIYVQVANELTKEETIEREFGNLLRIKDNYPKIIVTGEYSFENTYAGIQHIYIRDFLSKHYWQTF